MHDPVRIAVVHADTSRTGPCETVALWAASRIWEWRGFTLDLIELPDPGDPGSRSPADPRQRLARVEAVVMVTPEEEQGPAASLLHLIEGAAGEWRHKPVAFVSHGVGGRAVERLRRALEALQAAVLDEGICLADARDRFGEAGELPAADPGHAALETLLTRLQRTATALRHAPGDPKPCSRPARAGVE